MRSILGVNTFVVNLVQAKRDESIEAQNLLRERELKLQIEEQRQRQAQEQQLIEEAERAKELKVMERERKKQEERTRKELAKQDAVRAKAQQLAEKKVLQLPAALSQSVHGGPCVWR